jgi:hypothetical protein
MALLLLWEVDHGREFPRQGGDGPSAALLGFTRRLKQRVAADAELSQWLQPRDCHRALAPGLPPVHHVWWSVRISRPSAGEPQGWYEEFVRRWRLYLEALVQSAAAPSPAPATAESQSPAQAASSSATDIGDLPPAVPITTSSSSSAAHPAPQPQSSRQERRPPLPATSASATVPEGRPPKRQRRDTVTTEATRRRQRPQGDEEDQSLPGAKRQRDLRSWLQEPRPRAPPTPPGREDDAPPWRTPHGRAGTGPPT